jgi:hypothetical protein
LRFVIIKAISVEEAGSLAPENTTAPGTNEPPFLRGFPLKSRVPEREVTFNIPSIDVPLEVTILGTART